MILLIAFILAQGLDVVSWSVMDPGRELNPLVIALGASALWLKLALIGLVALGALAFAYRRSWQAVLFVGTGAGALGAWSNLPR